MRTPPGVLQSQRQYCTTCTGLGKTSAPVCRFHWLLSLVHPGLCWSVGATDGIDPERCPVCPTARQQVAFDTLKTCLINAPILGFPTEDGQFILADISLFAGGGGVLNQIQEDREVMIAYASWSLTISVTVLHDTQRDASGGCHVYPFSIVSMWSSVHSVYRSQLPSVAAEISEQ